jgi:hypothetical protein
MSRALNRIRSLVVEIDQIQKQGQKPTQTFTFPVEAAPALLRPARDAEPPAPKLPPQEAPEGRIRMEWSGAVVMELQLENSSERIELRRRGDFLEIHFADGKAFHIPFRVVA